MRYNLPLWCKQLAETPPASRHKHRRIYPGKGQITDKKSSLARAIEKYVQKDKAHYKWLRGGVEFVDVIPKSPSGKILRRVLRDKEKEMRLRRRAREANL